MTSINYSVSSTNEFKMKMLTGFSQLQQQEEFVDLTLAVDGCIVKVHRNVVALASPYLREVLKSLPNHYPVVFLSNVTQTTLSYLLEYIYHGEVKVPADSLNEFIELSKSLHITGIDGLELPKKIAANRNIPEKRASKTAAHITTDNDNLVEVEHSESSTFTANQHGSDSVKFLIGDHITQNDNMQQSHEHNEIPSPLIGINSNIQANINTNTAQSCRQAHDNNNLQSQTDNSIKESTRAQETNLIQPNYKFIVKTHNEANQAKTEELQNIPVIEIQHIESLGQQDQDMIIEDYEVLPMQTDILAQAIHKTLPIQETVQDGKADTPTVQFLENMVLKPVLKQSKRNVTTRLKQSRMDVTPGFKQSIMEVTPGFKQSTMEVTPGFKQSTMDVTPGFKQSTMDVTPGFKQSTMDVTPGFKQSTMDVTPGFKQSTIDVTPEVTWAKISVTPLEGNDALPLPLNDKIVMDTMKNMAQYSLTERGALQLILNRYMYWCHHETRVKKRWRCIDYRRQGCPAFLDTVNGTIVARKGLHHHGFHDKKIHKLHSKSLLYPTIELANAARDKKRMMSVHETSDKSDDTEW